MASLIHSLHGNSPGVVLDDCVTVQAASELTGYNVQHIRRLILAGKLDAYRVGRSWLIKVESLEAYLEKAHETGDRRFGPRADENSQRDRFERG